MKITKLDSKGKEYNYGGGYEDVYEVIPKVTNSMDCFMKVNIPKQSILLKVISYIT